MIAEFIWSLAALSLAVSCLWLGLVVVELVGEAIRDWRELRDEARACGRIARQTRLAHHEHITDEQIAERRR